MLQFDFVCTVVPFGPFTRSAGLLPLSRGRSFGRDYFHCHYGRYTSNQLSSGYRVPRILLAWVLTSHNFKVWTFFSVVGLFSYSFLRLLEKRTVITLASFFLVFFLRVCDCRFATDSSSHVSPHIQLHFSGIRCY